MPSPAQRSNRGVYYPETDRMGEHELQRFIAELLRPLIERWLTARKVVAHAGADTFMYWVEGDPTQRVAPDVYVLPGIEQTFTASSWKIWELGVGPSFAFEIVTGDWQKDYDDVPVSYAAMGTKELVIFDPSAKATSHRRFRWQVYRHVKGRGLIRVEVSQTDRVKSKSLGCWLRSIDVPGGVRVRLAEGAEGERIFPTEAEAQTARAEAETARAEAETARAEAETARAEAETARAEAQAARAEAETARADDNEREIARLRAELAALKRR